MRLPRSVLAGAARLFACLKTFEHPGQVVANVAHRLQPLLHPALLLRPLHAPYSNRWSQRWHLRKYRNTFCSASSGKPPWCQRAGQRPLPRPAYTPKHVAFAAKYTVKETRAHGRWDGHTIHRRARNKAIRHAAPFSMKAFTASSVKDAAVFGALAAADAIVADRRRPQLKYFHTETPSSASARPGSPLGRCQVAASWAWRCH